MNETELKRCYENISASATRRRLDKVRFYLGPCTAETRGALLLKAANSSIPVAAALVQCGVRLHTSLHLPRDPFYTRVRSIGARDELRTAKCYVALGLADASILNELLFDADVSFYPPSASTAERMRKCVEGIVLMGASLDSTRSLQYRGAGSVYHRGFKTPGSFLTSSAPVAPCVRCPCKQFLFAARGCEALDDHLVV